MTHARRKKDAKRIRKAVLREMKKLSKIIAKHAERHKDLLEKYWQETDFKEGDVRQILDRIGGVLEKLPEAVRQAHEMRFQVLAPADYRRKASEEQCAFKVLRQRRRF